MQSIGQAKKRLNLKCNNCEKMSFGCFELLDSKFFTHESLKAGNKISLILNY